MDLTPISTFMHPQPRVVVHARWAELMINLPLQVFILGHVTQALPSYVFGAMALVFLLVLLGYLSAVSSSMTAFALCIAVASVLFLFVNSCIYTLTVTLSYHRFVLQCSRRTQMTVLNQAMIRALGISTTMLSFGYPILFVLNAVGAMPTKVYLLTTPIFSGIYKAIFLAILQVTHLEGEAKRMEAIVEELKTDNEMQTKFLRFVYHEIRNPFNSIMLGLNHLEEEEPLVPYRELIVMLRRAANTMNKVIGDVVDLTQARGLQLIKEPVRIQAVVGSALEAVSDLVSDKKIEIQEDVSILIPPRMLADFVKLKKVFEVLISNAVKFSPAGSSIKLSLQVLDKSFNICTLSFSVKDSGPGIPEKMVPLIFQPFATVRPGDFSEDENRGSGLGLCFAKHLADLMNGTLCFTTTQDEGSIFTLEISLEICQSVDSDSSAWRFFTTGRFRTTDSALQSFASAVESRSYEKRFSTSLKSTGGQKSTCSSEMKVVPFNQKLSTSTAESSDKQSKAPVREQFPRLRFNSRLASVGSQSPQNELKISGHFTRLRFNSRMTSRGSLPSQNEKYSDQPEAEQEMKGSVGKYMLTKTKSRLSESNDFLEAAQDQDALLLCSFSSKTSPAHPIPVSGDMESASPCAGKEKSFKTPRKDASNDRPEPLVNLLPQPGRMTTSWQNSPDDTALHTMPNNHHFRLPIDKAHSYEIQPQERRSVRCVTFDSSSSESKNFQTARPSARESLQARPSARESLHARPSAREFLQARPSSRGSLQAAPLTSRPPLPILKAPSLWHEKKIRESPAETLKNNVKESPEDEKAEDISAQVLIVDDVKSNQKLVQMILEKVGYKCDLASDGMEALAMAQRHHYQLILMDNVMPIMDGVEATRRIVAFDKSVAIVGLTGNVLQKDQQEFIQAGARFIIEKPANKAQLLKACTQFVQARKK